MDKLWYYTQGAAQEKKGPVPEAEIKSLVAGGQIRATDLLWSEGMANWAPLSALPQLQTEHTTALPSPAAAAAQVFIHESALPEGLAGWMTLVSVTTIIMGAISLLGCNIVVAIPMIIAGSLLLGAKNALVGISTLDTSLIPFFNKLKSFMVVNGILCIINLITLVLIGLFIMMYFGAIMTAVAGSTGAHP